MKWLHAGVKYSKSGSTCHLWGRGFPAQVLGSNWKAHSFMYMDMNVFRACTTFLSLNPVQHAGLSYQNPGLWLGLCNRSTLVWLRLGKDIFHVGIHHLFSNVFCHIASPDQHNPATASWPLPLSVWQVQCKLQHQHLNCIQTDQN